MIQGFQYNISQFQELSRAVQNIESAGFHLILIKDIRDFADIHLSKPVGNL